MVPALIISIWQYAYFFRSDAVRSVISENKDQLDLLHPKLITSTKLRKQLASYSQLLNLDDNEVEAMASFMGMSWTNLSLRVL